MRKLVLVLLATLPLVLGLAVPAHAATFTDRRGDVSTANDIRRVTVGMSDSIAVRVHLREIRPGSLTIWFDLGNSRAPDLLWSSGIGGDTDYQLFRTRGWRAQGMPKTCNIDFHRNQRLDTVTAVVWGDCAPRNTPNRRVRVSVETAQCRTLGCRNTDYAPRRHVYYPWVNPGP